MLLEDRLHQLSVGPEKEKMYSQWIVIKERAEEKLNTVSTYFPHFSKHDGTHAQTIATQVGNLLGEDRVNLLSYSDLLLLLLSFYHHDIGMALDYETVYQYFHEENFQDALNKYANNPTSDLHDAACRLQRFGMSRAQDYASSIDVYNDVILIIEDVYRSEHASRSAAAVMDDSFLEHILHARCLRILSDICAVHQKPISELATLSKKENGFFGDYFHPRLVGALLCLGDLLDLDTDRFDEIAMRASTPFPHLSKLHLSKHKSVRHFLVEKNSIEVCADMDNIETYRIMRKWMDWMQETCDYITLHWSEIAPDDFGNAPRITKCELLLHGNAKWLPFANTRYEVSSKRMFELLQGSKIYGNKFVCLREIIQNAVDATLLRLFDEGILSWDGNEEDVMPKQLESLNINDFQITGEIKVEDNTHVRVTLRDKGIGISTEDIKKIAHVSNIAGEKRKKLIAQMPVWLRPAGAFGMGLQSIFLLSDQFEVITKTRDEAPKKITFQSAETSEGYITVEDYPTSFSQGTEISFVINGEKLSAQELRCPNYQYSRKLLSSYIVIQIKCSFPKLPLFDGYKTEDYVPVKVTLQNRDSSNERLCVEYTSLLDSRNLNPQFHVDAGYIEVRKLMPQLRCSVVARVRLEKRAHINHSGHAYMWFHEQEKYYHHTIFYRNCHVGKQNPIIESMNKAPIISRIDWRLNILDGCSDDVITIDRASFVETYLPTLYKILNGSLEQISKDMIDYLIQLETGWEKVGDTALILYQIAVQLNHRPEQFYNKYKAILNEIEIGGYFEWNKSGKDFIQKNIKVAELRDSNQKWYLILNEVDSKPEGILAQNLDEVGCFAFVKYTDPHILDHRAKRVFLGEKDGHFFKVIEFEPFQYNTPNNLYKVDDIFVLETLIHAINANFRVLPAMDEYADLITPSGHSENLLDSCRPYYIELPFGDYLSDMKDRLEHDGFIRDAVHEFETNIIQSDLFSENANYIADYTGKSPSEIKVKYAKLVHMCLTLLQDEQYKEFNRSILERVDAFYSITDKLSSFENSPYFTFKSLLLE